VARGGLLGSDSEPVVERDACQDPRRPWNLLQISWGVSVAAYVGCVTLTNVLPLPQLGWAHVAAAAPDAPQWAHEPYRTMAAGVSYFTIQSLWDLFGERWVAPR
jgi:hypothetical protein